MNKRFKWNSIVFTTVLQSIYCFQVLFYDTSNSLYLKLLLVAVFSLSLSIVLLYVKDETAKSIGSGILIGTILTTLVMSLTALFE